MINKVKSEVCSNKTKTILYIEDNCANLRMVASILRREKNLLLLSAMNGEIGIELINDYLPNLILLDLHLPDMNGYEVLEKIKSNPVTKNIPVIALTADAMLQDIEDGLSAGFENYITKPIILDEFMESINTVLEKSLI